METQRADLERGYRVNLEAMDAQIHRENDREAEDRCYGSKGALDVGTMKLYWSFDDRGRTQSEKPCVLHL